MNYNISFEFDSETKKVSKVHVEEIKEKEALLDGAFVTVSSNKVELTKDAANLLGVAPGDKIAIKYFTENNETTFPVIGKADVFKDVEGNKLTKALSISFRGDQRKMLLEYGVVFKVEDFKDGMFKMVPQQVEEIEKEESTSVEEAKTKLDNFVGMMDIHSTESEDSTNEDLPF